MIRGLIEERFGQVDLIDGADHLIVGIVDVMGTPHAIYEEEELIKFFSGGKESRMDEAMDWISYNLVGSNIPGAPLVMVKREDICPDSLEQEMKGDV